MDPCALVSTWPLTHSKVVPTSHVKEGLMSSRTTATSPMECKAIFENLLQVELDAEGLEDISKSEGSGCFSQAPLGVSNQAS